MKSKIILTAIILAPLYVLQPNIGLLQGFNSDKAAKMDFQNVSQYRNNPAKYFNALLEKQNSNAINFSTKTEFKKHKEEYYRKNLFSKNVAIKDDETITTVNKNGTNYIYTTKNKKYKPSGSKQKAQKYSSPNYSTHANSSYFYPYLDTANKVAFKYEKWMPNLNKKCSVWTSTNPKQQLEYCINEDLGIVFYLKAIGNDEVETFEVKELTIGQTSDKEFSIPGKVLYFINKDIFKKSKKSN